MLSPKVPSRQQHSEDAIHTDYDASMLGSIAQTLSLELHVLGTLTAPRLNSPAIGIKEVRIRAHACQFTDLLRCPLGHSRVECMAWSKLQKRCSGAFGEHALGAFEGIVSRVGRLSSAPRVDPLTGIGMKAGVLSKAPPRPVSLRGQRAVKAIRLQLRRTLAGRQPASAWRRPWTRLAHQPERQKRVRSSRLLDRSMATVPLGSGRRRLQEMLRLERRER
jgi:hypothetical protein